ncbi:hypothetical protein H4R20_002991 [Coemansia guatemalensis]|uniref:P-loop containing nucleoside triphosphate hydrolase protein n=1 Tax=Coemansia guatemalensis TaxID=2761395 RepID=A0A9W8LTG4_9FUNG|nr:hypothetical protein H4R20_002991 [Coemansia guatemalensis]
MAKLLMGYRDQRMGIMSEVITGIRIVKMYAWESSFIKRINNVRVSKELETIRKNSVLKIAIRYLKNLMPYLVSFATFGTYSLFDNVSRGPFGAKIIFVSMPLFSLLRIALAYIPEIVPSTSKAIASSRRISKFLTASEIDISAINRQPYDRDIIGSSDDDVLVSIDGGTFKYTLSGNVILRNINIECTRNGLVAIIGRIGSGKSSLVSAILGDMIKYSGNVAVRGSIAYVPQQPWILNATIRDNILFGSNYDREFYEQVIDACALRQDLDALPTGDMTEIGERGINLSGGQKMRVSLARAVYSRADVYLLDDPLAAVDAHVSKHIFTHVLGPQGLLQSRARILVTNAVQYLNNVDNIVMLNNNTIVEQGSFRRAMNRRGDIFEFVHRHIGGENTFISSGGILSSTENISNGISDIGGSGISEQSMVDANAISIRKAPICSDKHVLPEQSGKQTNDDGRITTTELRQKGAVKWKIYRAYINSSGALNVLIIVVTLALLVIVEVCSNLWLKHWSADNAVLSSFHATGYYLSIYGVFGIFFTFVELLRLFFIWNVCAIQASKIVHQNMLTSVMHLPMLFFDTTPTGRILNRFSSDLEQCDEKVPASVSSTTIQLCGLVTALVIIAIVAPLSLTIMPLLILVGTYYQRLYISSSREIKRLDSTTRSPIYAYFHESVSGVSTIRAFGQQSRFIAEIEHLIGQHMRVDNAYRLINQWLPMRLETMGSILMCAAALKAVASMHYSGVGNPAVLGLVISSTFTLANTSFSILRNYGNLEVAMTHLERAVEYGNLPSEAANIIEDCRPKEVWPEQGVVEFKNYSTRYREGLDLVLKDLSFRVAPRQKVGIVGRTGAGKSSLTLALFRIIEAAGGQILLDGEDISQYGLFDVRSKLSIIPQDPVLFAGTVRENLDPFGSYSDQDIWRALEQAHLAEYIRSKDERLEYMVTQSGENLSVGQRQLICLARALLKHAKVLVLDEATAAIDNATDEIIQQTIRSEFKNCTVLTIAHRLDTVIDSDMILVIDGGRVAEYDMPQNLLAKRDSMFAKLVEEAQNSRAQ